MIAAMRNVTKLYGRNYGVRNLNLTLPAGEVVGLLGVNGSGKTTVLKLLAGLLVPTSGEVTVLGAPPRHNRARIAFLGETDALYRWMNPRDAERLMSGLYPDFRPARYRDLLDQLRVPGVKAGAMSKGERMRLRLAMSLARDALLYLFDEPLGGIDLVSRERIIRSLVAEWRTDATVIVATHAVAESEGLFDRVVFLDRGELVLDARAEDLRAQGKSVRATFLEVLG